YYRAARREGLEKEAAKTAAIDRALDDKLAADGITGEAADRQKAFTKDVMGLTERVASNDGQIDRSIRRDLNASTARLTGSEPLEPIELDDNALQALSDVPWDDSEPQTSLAAADLALLRQVRFDWDDLEAGAPRLDPKQPFGRRDLFAQLRDIVGDVAASDLDLASRYIRLNGVMNSFLHEGTLAPGTYSLPRQEHAGAGADDAFTVTGDHIKVLKAARFEWCREDDAEERLDNGEWPAPVIDPKRPYGDMTFYQVEVAQAVGRLPPPEVGLSDEMVAEMTALHFDMAKVFPIYFAHAVMPTLDDD
ncbi:MAG: hypothetical protein AAFV26_03880, partial [Pseudomonadota bacterium]